MKVTILGHSRRQLPIMAYEFGSKGPRVLILGGVHGNESEGVIAALGLMEAFTKKYPFHLRITIVPMFNLDGVMGQERCNSHGVDLNRNLPTKDWQAETTLDKYFPGPSPQSEPESKALVKWLKANKPKFILSLHSWNPMLNVNGNCLREAQAIQKVTQYAIEESVGYPTPGCLGTYAGLERNMPTLTYEIERGLETEKILKIHVPAILKALKVTQKTRT